MLPFPNLDVTALAAVQKRARRYATIVIVGLAVALMYMALSLGFIYYLHQTDIEACHARQAARSAIREGFALDPDWTDARQAVLDLNLPPKVVC